MRASQARRCACAILTPARPIMTLAGPPQAGRRMPPTSGRTSSRGTCLRPRTSHTRELRRTTISTPPPGGRPRAVWRVLRSLAQLLLLVVPASCKRPPRPAPCPTRSDAPPCDALFCPAYSLSLSPDPLAAAGGAAASAGAVGAAPPPPDMFVAVGLDSGLTDFRRPRLNLVLLLDVSGSMQGEWAEQRRCGVGGARRRGWGRGALCCGAAAAAAAPSRGHARSSSAHHVAAPGS